MAGEATFAALIGESRDSWIGTPKSAYDEACPVYTMLRKRDNLDWEGGDGAPQVKLPYRYGLPGAGSATVSSAWNNAGVPASLRWLLTPGRYFQAAAEDFDSHYLIKPGANGNTDIWAHLMTTHPQKFAKVMSVFFWGNGGGAFARGSGSGSAATGTTFTLKNALCAKFFDGGPVAGQGDIIDFSAADGTSGSLRSVTRTIVGINRRAGTLTLDASLTGTGVLDNDYVFLHSTHGQLSTGRPMTGVAAWNPVTHAEAITSLYGQTRSDNPTKKAGIRLTTSVGKDPWVTILSMLRVCREESADVDVIAVPPRVVDALVNSARPVALSAVGGGGGMRNRAKSMPGGMGMTINEAPTYSSPVKDNPADMRYGVNGIEVSRPGGRKAWVVETIYMADINATEATDETYRGMRLDDWVCILGEKMPGWLSPDDKGARYWRVGTEFAGALYGGIGNYGNRVPANQIVASPNATES